MNNMKHRMLLYFLVITSLLACKSDLKKVVKNTKIDQAYQSYTNNANKETASKYLATVTAALAEQKDPSDIKLFVEQAIQVANKEGMKLAEAGFLSSFIKSNNMDVSNEIKAVRLLDIFKELNNINAYNSLAAGFLYRYPNSTKGKELLKELGTLPNPDEYFKEKGRLLFGENGNSITKGAAISYVDAVEAFVMLNPHYAKASRFLERAAEVAIAAKTYPKALAIFDWIIDKFSQSKEAPRAVFMKGLVFDDYLNKNDLARVQYEKFLKDYPSHSFANDVRFSLETLDKSDEEIQKYLEEIRLKNANK